MGLFNLFSGKKQPQIPLTEFLNGCNDAQALVAAATWTFDVSWDFEKSLPQVQTTGKGKHCLYFLNSYEGEKVTEIYKKESVDGFYLLERACECGSSLAALYLAVFYQHGVGKTVNGLEDITANLHKAMKYYNKAIELGGDGARLAGVFVKLMEMATVFNDMAGREEALILSAAYAASYYGSIYEEVQGLLIPEDKKNIQWLVSLVVCWYASQGYSACLAFVGNMIHDYDNEKGYVKRGMFYDRFLYMSSRQDEAIRMIKTYLVPKIKAGEQNTIEALKFFGWNIDLLSNS